MNGLSRLAGMAASCGSANDWNGIWTPDGLDLSLWVDPMDPTGPMLAIGDYHIHKWRGHSILVEVTRQRGGLLVIECPTRPRDRVQAWITKRIRGWAKHQRRYARRGAKMRGGK